MLLGTKAQHSPRRGRPTNDSRAQARRGAGLPAQKGPGSPHVPTSRPPPPLHPPPAAPEWGVLLGQGQKVIDIDGPLF